MAYDANGNWVPESASVSDRVTGLISKDSSFIQRAKTEAKQQANKRGLLNSSIAVQAGEEAAQKAALPIAAQEAQQIQQSNLSKQDDYQQEQRNIAQRTFQAAESEAERTSRSELQAEQIASQESEGAAERETRQGLLTQELKSREDIAAADRKLQEAGIASNEKIAELDAQTRVRLSNLSAETQQYVAQLQVQGSERQKATEAVVNLSAQYADIFTRIQNDPNIPADARSKSLEHIAALRDSNFAMIQRLYTFPIEWSSPQYGGGTPPITTGGGPGAAAPAAPAPAVEPNFSAPTFSSPGNYSPPDPGDQTISV